MEIRTITPIMAIPKEMIWEGLIAERKRPTLVYIIVLNKNSNLKIQMQLFKNNQIKLGDKLFETLVQIDNLCEHLLRLESDGKIQSEDAAIALDAFTNLHALKTRLKELEMLVAQLQPLLSLKDDELATYQDQLATKVDTAATEEEILEEFFSTSKLSVVTAE